VETYESLLNAPFKVPQSHILFRATGTTPTNSLMNYVAPEIMGEAFVAGAPLLISVVAEKLEIEEWRFYALSPEREAGEQRSPGRQSMVSEIVGSAKGTVLSMRSRKIGRNERCPCGSGKKFKKCHGAAGVA
jgi:hypothetical protein